MNQEQINALKYHRIPIDKVIALVDKNEENPGKTLLSRAKFEENYLMETEMEKINGALNLCRDTYGEENVKEISIEGSI